MYAKLDRLVRLNVQMSSARIDLADQFTISQLTLFALLPFFALACHFFYRVSLDVEASLIFSIQGSLGTQVIF